MEWLDILGAGASVASGGIFGLLGSVAGAWFKGKDRLAKAVEQDKQRVHDLKLIALKMEAKSQGAAWDSMVTTHQSETALNGQENYKWVVAIKSLFRPFLTISLWLLAAWQLDLILTGTINTYLELAEANQTLLATNELVALVRYVLYSTVFSAMTASTWWFGERALSMPEFKNR
jgi:hypothetical protein